MLSHSDENEKKDADTQRLLEERARILKELEEMSDLEDEDDEETPVEDPIQTSVETPIKAHISPPPAPDEEEGDQSPPTPGKEKLNTSFSMIDKIADKHIYDYSEVPSETNSNDLLQNLRSPGGSRNLSRQNFFEDGEEDEEALERFIDLNSRSNSNSREISQEKESGGFSKDGESSCPYGYSEENDYFDADLEELLEKPLEDSNTEDLPSDKVWKTVLERVDHDRFTKLPEGWVLVTHNCGMPMFLHKPTRIITHSRPYHVATSIRDHVIPLSAIPCLFRKRIAEIEQEKRENIEKTILNKDTDSNEVSTASRIATHVLNGAKVGIVENQDDFSLTTDQYQEYCSKLFKFKKIMITRYATTSAKIEARNEKRVDSMLHRAGFTGSFKDYKDQAEHDMMITAPSGAILIDVTPIDQKRTFNKKPFLLNPTGRTTVTVLNEFMQRLVKGRLEYECEDNRNVTCPYKSTVWLTLKTTSIVQIGGTTKEKLTLLKEQADLNGCMPANVPADCKKFPIGRGIGHSKKTARLAAAKDALSKLIPSLRVKEDFTCEGAREKKNEEGKGYDEEAMELFDKLKVESKNVTQLCAKFGMTKPYSLLRDAVSRSIRWNGKNLECTKDLVGNGSQLSVVTLKLGDMEETAEANGVKPAMQLAAQKLLKRLNPELDSYGSFLRLFGGFEDKAIKENAKKQHDEVVRLQNKGSHLQPNHAVLSKLKEEMKNVALVHPPRQFLYGYTSLASSALARNLISTSTQTDGAIIAGAQKNAQMAPPRFQPQPNVQPFFIPPSPPYPPNGVQPPVMMYQQPPPPSNTPIPGPFMNPPFTTPAPGCPFQNSGSMQSPNPWSMNFLSTPPPPQPNVGASFQSVHNSGIPFQRPNSTRKRPYDTGEDGKSPIPGGEI